MQARLFCKTGQLAGASFTITGDASIGKASDNAIQLYPEIVSSHHARISFDSKRGCYVLTDLDSRNGTRIDGASVHGSAALDRLNVITFANKFDFVFQVLDERAQARAPKDAPAAKRGAAPPEKNVAPASAPAVPKQESDRGRTMLDDGAFTPPARMPASPAEPPAAAAGDLAGAGKTVFGDAFEAVPDIPDGGAAADDAKSAASGRTMMDDSWGAPSPPPAAGASVAGPAPARVFRLALVAVDGTTSKTFTLKQGENIAGRDPASDIAIEDASMSRRHAAVVVDGGAVRVRDLGSKNGTYVGEVRITGDTALAPGVALHFGSASLRLLADD